MRFKCRNEARLTVEAIKVLLYTQFTIISLIIQECTGVIKRSVRHDRASYNKEILLKPKVIDGINCNQWKLIIQTFL